MVFTLIAKFISVLKGFFKKEHAIVKVNIEQIPMMIEKEFLIKKNALENLSAKKFSEIKYLHSKCTGLIEELKEKELEGKENERLNRAVLTSKHQIEHQLKKLLEKINPTDRGNTLDDARAYSGESYALLINEIVSFRKNIIYTSFYLKEEMKEIGEILQEMINIFIELNKNYAENKDLFDFEKLKENIGSITEKKHSLSKLNEQLATVNTQISEKESLFANQKENILKKKVGKEMVEVKHLEEEMTKLMSEKQDLKTQISALLINVDRPLARFKQLVDSGRWKISKEEKEMLDLFITNPILALKKDPKAEIFKKVLTEIVKAIEEGAVELKDKEKETRLAALSEIINFDFFGKVFWKMNELQKKQIDLNKELSKSAAKTDLEKEERKEKEMDKELFELKEKVSFIERQTLAIKKSIADELTQIKEFTQKVTGKTLIFEEEAL
ncbi:MAG: hypothetical protein WCW44_00050 [archaeon]|jgi:hypothetical protein